MSVDDLILCVSITNKIDMKDIATNAVTRWIIFNIRLGIVSMYLKIFVMTGFEGMRIYRKKHIILLTSLGFSCGIKTAQWYGELITYMKIVSLNTSYANNAISLVQLSPPPSLVQRDMF